MSYIECIYLEELYAIEELPSLSARATILELSLQEFLPLRATVAAAVMVFQARLGDMAAMPLVGR